MNDNVRHQNHLEVTTMFHRCLIYRTHEWDSKAGGRNLTVWICSQLLFNWNTEGGEEYSEGKINKTTFTLQATLFISAFLLTSDLPNLKVPFHYHWGLVSSCNVIYPWPLLTENMNCMHMILLLRTAKSWLAECDDSSTDSSPPLLVMYTDVFCHAAVLADDSSASACVQAKSIKDSDLAVPIHVALDTYESDSNQLWKDQISVFTQPCKNWISDTIR